MNKHVNRHKHNVNIFNLIAFSVVATVGLAFFDKLTSEYVTIILGLFAYGGNHTYNNMKTTPTKDEE